MVHQCIAILLQNESKTNPVLDYNLNVLYYFSNALPSSCTDNVFHSNALRGNALRALLARHLFESTALKALKALV